MSVSMVNDRDVKAEVLERLALHLGHEVEGTVVSDGDGNWLIQNVGGETFLLDDADSTVLRLASYPDLGTEAETFSHGLRLSLALVSEQDPV